ncbi:hypothetical protein F4861DRAFT_337677 [Xylaria intraflava]|nr:hypothetical protein F4861DRAFT_337677 [Xylaria intraflava]
MTPAGSRREMHGLVHARRKDQDSAMLHIQAAQSGCSDPRASNVNVPPYSYTMHRERRHRPSQMTGRSSSLSERDAIIVDGNIVRDGPMFPPESPLSSVKRLDEYRSRAQNKGGRARKHSQMPILSVPSVLESTEHTNLPNSHRKREKAMRYHDEAYLTAGHQNVPSLRSRDFLTSDTDDEESSSDLYLRGNTGDSLAEISSNDEGRLSYVPSAPVIPRLPTPDFEPTSPYELGLGPYSFCPCCTSGEREEADGVCCVGRKAKMNEQVDFALAYISQTRGR